MLHYVSKSPFFNQCSYALYFCLFVDCHHSMQFCINSHFSINTGNRSLYKWTSHIIIKHLSWNSHSAICHHFARVLAICQSFVYSFIMLIIFFVRTVCFLITSCVIYCLAFFSWDSCSFNTVCSSAFFFVRLWMELFTNGMTVNVCVWVYVQFFPIWKMGCDDNVDGIVYKWTISWKSIALCVVICVDVWLDVLSWLFVS